MKRKQGAKQIKSKQLMGWRERTGAAEAPLPAPVHHQRCTNNQQPTAPNNPTTTKAKQPSDNSTRLFNNPTCDNLTTVQQQPNLQRPDKHTTTQQSSQQGNNRKPNNLQKNTIPTLSITQIKNPLRSTCGVVYLDPTTQAGSKSTLN